MKRSCRIWGCLMGSGLVLAIVACGSVSGIPPGNPVSDPLGTGSDAGSTAVAAPSQRATPQSAAQPISQTVERCEESLSADLAMCGQTPSAEAAEACLHQQRERASTCYGSIPKGGGLDCVFKNFGPFWDDCKMPCFFHWNMPWMEALSSRNRPNLPWGKTYMDCLGICADEYFNKRCNNSGT